MARARSVPPVPPTLPVVLVTGFEPFGGDDFNPSIEVARRLDGWTVPATGSSAPRARVRAEQLPCVFGDALDALDGALARHRPTLVIALGLGAGRADVSVERVAINVDDARIPDNAGAQPIDAPVRPGGPAAYWSTLPIKAIVAAIRAAGLPASVSQTAGTFVCNHVFYGLAHRIAGRRTRKMRGGFIHLPFPVDRPGSAPADPDDPDDPASANAAPGLTLAEMVEAIRIAVRVSVEQADGDLRETGGAID